MCNETQLVHVRAVIRELLFRHTHGELFDISVLTNMMIGDPVEQEAAIKLTRYATDCHLYADTIEAFVDWLNYKHGFDIQYSEVGL